MDVLLSAEALAVAGTGLVIAILVVPSPNPAPTRPAGIEGQPDLRGTVQQGLGSLSGKLTIRRRDAGSGDVELWLDADQSLRTKDGSHSVVGHLGSDGVHLTPGGEAYVLKQLGMTPPAGQQQPSPAAQAPGEHGPTAPAPRVGAGYEVRDQAERDIVADLAARGIKDSQSINNALEAHRRKAGVAAGSGITTGTGTGAQADSVTGKAPDGSPEAPYPGPDMTPMDHRERELVERMRKEHASEADIKKALADLRAKFGPTDAKNRRNQERNAGLPDALTTDSNRARQNAYDSDQRLRDAIKGKKVSWKDFAAHHLVPLEVIKKWQSFFEAAARAGWNTDEIANVIGLPRTDDAQRRMQTETGERRPLHDSGHKNWNTEAKRRMQDIEDQLKLKNMQPGPDYDQEVRRRLEQLQRDLRGTLPRDRLTMGDAPATEAA